ncbi:hypothetical protein D3C87_704090 [compost metagenome]
MQGLLQAGGVPEDQGRALVGGEAAGEAQGERFGIQEGLGFLELGVGLAVAQPLGLHALADELDHPVLEEAVDVPKLGVGHGFELLPGGVLLDAFMPLLAQVGVEERAELGGEPGLGVDAVGDRGDGHLGLGDAGPEVVPDAAGDLAMQLAHAVGLTREAQGQDGETEERGAGGLVVAAERHELFAVEAKRAPEAVEVALHHVEGERVVARGDRGVRGEDGVGGRGFQRLVEGHSLGLHQFAAALEVQEGRVAFVHVPDFGVIAQLAKGADAADAQEDFLGDAHVLVTAVELGREATIFGGVVGDVGVEQV